MEKSKKKAPLIAHVVLMGLLCALSIVSAIIIFTGNIPSGFEASEATYKTTAALYGAAHVVNALALTCGITYLLKGSGKSAAIWYKTLILLIALGVTLRLVGTLIHPGFGVNACLMIVIILALLALRFIKNLGKTRTWIIFFILIALELVLAVLTFDKNEVMASIAGNLSRLVLDGTIGISIYEKYADKAKRKAK
ncbi:MAG: hypothetical protein IJT49_06140 [Clostridia bacterium]|nr:hypothetical protein [Clostridia bacterium]